MRWPGRERFQALGGKTGLEVHRAEPSHLAGTRRGARPGENTGKDGEIPVSHTCVWMAKTYDFYLPPLCLSHSCQPIPQTAAGTHGPDHSRLQLKTWWFLFHKIVLAPLQGVLSHLFRLTQHYRVLALTLHLSTLS